MLNNGNAYWPNTAYTYLRIFKIIKEKISAAHHWHTVGTPLVHHWHIFGKGIVFKWK